MKTAPRGNLAVMADRMTAAEIEADADPVRRLHLQLGYFPTPPWATRALLAHVLCLAPSAAHQQPARGHISAEPSAPLTCWEPAAGQGHMAAVLAEVFDEVWRTDVHDFGGLNQVGSFVAPSAAHQQPARGHSSFDRGLGLDVVASPPSTPDWIITNPPFPEAEAFALRAICEARRGVALLVRSSWLEGEGRYRRLFQRHPPAIVANFVERVPMVLGRWDPEASTATAYTWVVWDRAMCGETRHRWIPPGRREALTRRDDARRFAAPEPQPEGQEALL